MANQANDEMVSKVAYDLLKRKIREDGKQMKMMEALIAKGFQFPTKRARICLTVPDFAKAIEQMKAMKAFQEQFLVESDPVEVAGFQWTLYAFGMEEHFAFHLRASPPAEYAESAYEFKVEYLFHLLGNTPSHDIHKSAEESAPDGGAYLQIKDWIFDYEEDMATFPANFLQSDGSIRAELDFAIKGAKFCWDNEEDDEQNEEIGPMDAAAHVDVPAGGVQGVQQQPGSPMDG